MGPRDEANSIDSALPLSKAALYVSCETIFVGRQCPRCGSACFLWLAAIVGSLSDNNGAPEPGLGLLFHPASLACRAGRFHFER